MDIYIWNVSECIITHDNLLRILQKNIICIGCICCFIPCYHSRLDYHIIYVLNLVYIQLVLLLFISHSIDNQTKEYVFGSLYQFT